jgi:hypothetical protein
VLRKIGQVFESKVMADTIDDRDGRKRCPLPEWIHEHCIAQYGLKTIADNHFRKFCRRPPPECSCDETQCL